MPVDEERERPCLFVCGHAQRPVRLIARHLRDALQHHGRTEEKRMTTPYRIVLPDSLEDGMDRIRASDDAKLVFLVRNPIDYVSAAGGSAGAVREWNADLAAAETLVNAGRALVVSYERLFHQRAGWSEVSRYLDVPIDAPVEPSDDPPASLPAPVIERVLLHARIDRYRTLLRGEPVLRMYQGDRDVVDYPYEEIGARFAVRRANAKPVPAVPDICIVGAAGCFGRFAKEPFADIVARRTGFAVANLGFGGARPEAYLSDPVLMERIEQAGTVIVELMSGRGYENDMLRSTSPILNSVEVKPAYRPLLPNLDFDQHIFVDWVWERAFKHLPPEDVEGLIAQSSAQLERDLKALLDAAPNAILFHFAQTPLPETVTRETYAFPHLVTQAMAERLSTDYELCSVVSTAGVPSPLINRHTGAPEPLMKGWPDPTVNAYYPTPEMHREAAEALIPILESRR